MLDDKLQRLASPNSGERRGARRRPENRPIVWRVARGRRQRPGRIVERSLYGLVIQTDADSAAPAGARLHPGTGESVDRLGFRSAVIQRVEAPNPEIRLMFAEIEA